MRISHFHVGWLATNCYVLTDESTGKTAVIDPGDFPQELSDSIESIGADNIEYVLLTHCHFDHILGAKKLAEKFKAKVAIHVLDAAGLSDGTANGSGSFGVNVRDFPEPDILLNDGDELKIGDLSVKVMHTPGHTPGGCCYICEDVIFSGDTLFCGGCGRCDLPGGDYEVMLKSLAKLAELPGNYRVYPGHDIKTELDRERRTNPYMKN